MSAEFDFSIVLETENLATADLQGLVRSLASLANQDPSPIKAREVLLIESGDIPADLLMRLTEQYPWVKVCSAPLGTGYYESKMLGAKLATGEIVVYYDSDCLYESGWLRKILAPFTYSEEIQVVAGETTTNGVGFYGTAMALGYIFPQYSGRSGLTPGKHYFLNNVAFRRSFLLAYPIPIDLPLYRGNCAIHAHELIQSGTIIWQQPKARALHAPPNGLSHFFWRFLLIGHDYYWQKKLIPTSTNAEPTMTGKKGKFGIFIDRISKMVDRDFRHAYFLLFSLPIVILSSLLIYVGYVITSRQPNYLLKTYNKL
ncbi:MAG: glycosyltransferase family 2 protein [Plectolyngbya sp. WJT66-NPBG17]|jgi:glycosyltransferase involved in cell wall biosynthesis|nr:glycosyltransferase family 2 protein [Plectolyngbya sp. WJT66-NPBG17]MBW4524988.1 glycosyltransferase family 2 protein [Phormidium tanganyikae FI6-MK23]